MSSSPEATMSTGPDRHWFVAIDDMDVGPIDIAEIEARWRARELSAESLAWRPGMAEWQTIDTIPELAYLLEQLEQTSPEPVLPDVQWVMADATSLSDLVAMELEAPGVATPRPVAAAAGVQPATSAALANAGAMGLPNLATLGFGPQPQQQPASRWDDGWGLPAAPAAFPPGPAPWVEPETGDSKRVLMIALIGAGFLVLTLGLVLAVIELVRGPPPAPAPKPEVAALQPVTPAPAEPDAPPPLEPVAPAAAPKPEPAVAPAPRPAPKPAPKPARRPTTRQSPPSAPAPALDRLSKQDILTAIKRNARNLMPCLKAARAKTEIPAGRIKFVLNWTIEADGSVSRPRLKGPARVLRTSVPKCFAAQMRQWQFPASSRSSNIKNFGLPIKLK